MKETCVEIAEAARAMFDVIAKNDRGVTPPGLETECLRIASNVWIMCKEPAQTKVASQK